MTNPTPDAMHAAMHAAELLSHLHHMDVDAVSATLDSLSAEQRMYVPTCPGVRSPRHPA